MKKTEIFVTFQFFWQIEFDNRFHIDKKTKSSYNMKTVIKLEEKGRLTWERKHHIKPNSCCSLPNI